ncbi:hypothetical protein C497_01105 [Halalkalicoccus jeotgali B3]|uniref:Uncharacterized protein n=1 Tax=Halalkalicoccus jeotgali (strain DSM 18796 / CECT 7217 / JCM 14584 / KCTC 4019 / B3) TaxID=795797 RepID=D8JBD3_HALJB|nr:hypothetical protein HacjB3_16141 [Halalkalicoccus jeotgali B3]ELY41317.1 hypothetical protein C497_01105 [Halalkalicoccus jeotgali B3]
MNRSKPIGTTTTAKMNAVRATKPTMKCLDRKPMDPSMAI